MSIIRKGLRYGDQEDNPVNPQQYGSTGFEANRNRTNFDKDVDNLLFGDMRPPPRKRKQADQKPAQPAKKPTPVPPPVEPKKPSQPPQQISKPKAPQIKKPDPPKKPQPPAPPKKIDNYVQEKPKPAPKQKQVVQEQPRNVKQTDAQQVTASLDNNVFYNRPGYIRKLKKIAEDFNFYDDNNSKHRFIEVLRPSQTVRGLVRKLNTPNYQDHQFPPNASSIGFQNRKQNFQWKKPQQVFKSPVFGKYVDPNDIQPGTMSSPQFLSTLSCLAQRQQNIKRLIQNQKVNINGFYYVRIHVNGVWRYVAVDDNLPEQDGQALGARSFNDSQSQLWVSLIEKAYAKVYHGYNTFSQKNIPREHYLRDLTGAAVRRYEITDPQINDIIVESLSYGFPIVAVPSQKITQIGFNPNYSLSVVKSTGKGVQFRSSWGTIVERPKANLSREGVFQISSGDLRNYISHILVAQTDPNLYSTTIQSKHHGSFYSCFSFKLNNPNPNGTITISQFDRRLFSFGYKYQYAPFRVILEKKNVQDEQSNSLFVNAGFSHNSRNLDLAVNLTPGTYYVYCIGEWGSQSYDFDLTVYATQLVTLTKINHANFPNIIAEALTNLNLSTGKRSAKGNVDEYILYHEPSNLILITALSLVDRAFNHTLNLQQIKPQNLSLLNAVRPEDTFGKKFRKDIQSYKSNVFNQKTWDVNLLPNQKYTWVFSNNQDYDPTNFKNWGFK